MATAHDVAAYILERSGPMSTMKLQKLVYYSQAWSLVWDEDVLFDDEIQAWANGPVVPSLYNSHRGLYRLGAGAIPGDSKALTVDQAETVDAVLEYYGGRNSQWLSDLTHREKPWLDARRGLDPGERSTQQITPAAMLEYYSSL